MIAKLRELVSYRDWFREWIYLQLYQRYQGSVLGFLWTLLYPLLVFLSLSVVFSFLNHWNLKDYGLYFASGYVVWNFFANTCQHAAEAIPGSASFVTRVYVPKALLPLSSLAVNFVDLIAGLVLIHLFMPILGAPYSWSLAFLPVAILLLVAFVAGASLLCAMANVFVRDFRHLLGSALFLWFFFSPILWKKETLPAQIRPFLDLNPVAPFLTLFQEPIWHGALPGNDAILQCSAWAVATALAGSFLFFRSERKFYFHL
jgi:ABC-type polysaccharide/polyol phosphate export permease